VTMRTPSVPVGSRRLYILVGVVFFGVLLLVTTYNLANLASFEFSFHSQEIVSSKASAATPVQHESAGATSPAEPVEQKDYTDLIFANRNIFYGTRHVSAITVGPWRGKIPKNVVAGKEFTMTFTCSNPEESYCPEYYMLLFVGPTREAVPPDRFSKLTWTNVAPSNWAELTVSFTLNTPGEYTVYAYPELYYCAQWLKMKFSFVRAAVEGTPFKIVVQGPRAKEEGYGVCSSEGLYEGRYLSTNFNEEMTQLYGNTTRQHVYAPYGCKIPARTLFDAAPLIPDGQHFLFLGDSVSRNPFCRIVWHTIHGTVKDGPCDPDPDSFHFTNKLTQATINDRTVKFSFVWTPRWDSFAKDGVPVVLSLDPPPTHVVIAVGLYSHVVSR
jgi:hypothetical protein